VWNSPCLSESVGSSHFDMCHVHRTVTTHQRHHQIEKLACAAWAVSASRIGSRAAGFFRWLATCKAKHPWRALLQLPEIRLHRSFFGGSASVCRNNFSLNFDMKKEVSCPLRLRLLSERTRVQDSPSTSSLRDFSVRISLFLVFDHIIWSCSCCYSVLTVFSSLGLRGLWVR
jgi:hypothetical protein